MLLHFVLVVNTSKDFRTVLCDAGVVYERQLAKSSAPCGGMSTREKSVFVPGLLELMGMELFRERRWSPIFIGCVVTPSARLVVYFFPWCFRLYELRSQSTINQCENIIATPLCGAVSTAGRNRLSSPACQNFGNGHRTLSLPTGCRYPYVRAPANQR